MVKLTYIGAKATGLVTYPNGSIGVVRGHSYDVSIEVAKHLLKTTQWESTEQNEVKKEVKEINEVKKVKNYKSSEY